MPDGAILAVVADLPSSAPPPPPPPPCFPPFFPLPLAFLDASIWLANPARALLLPRFSLGPLAGLGSMQVTLPLKGMPLFQTLVAFFASSSVGKATTLFRVGERMERGWHGGIEGSVDGVVFCVCVC